MKILSLFDGMACGMIAMLNAGIEIESYDAYEIDKYAIKVSSHNFPNIRHHGDVFKADFTQYEGCDFLIGGSPCTYWSIAKKSNRETVASGMGWQLFSQYMRAVKETKPKFFIYENNKSMSGAIRESIDRAFGFEAIHINSALLSAQNRQRLYWVGMRNPDGTYSKVPVDQPEDRYILLCDVIHTGEPINTTTNGKAQCLRDTYYKDGIRNLVGNNVDRRTGVAAPVEVDSGVHSKTISCADGKTYPVYEVKDGQVTIKGRKYPIRLADGFYIFRKLTVAECMRLQTVPEWYDFSVISNSQAYKCLGNGWTCDVITHLIKTTQEEKVNENHVRRGRKDAPVRPPLGWWLGSVCQ